MVDVTRAHITGAGPVHNVDQMFGRGFFGRVPAVAKKFKLMWGKLLSNPLAGMRPRKPSGDSGLAFASSG
jgi:hypothetical protein